MTQTAVWVAGRAAGLLAGFAGMLYAARSLGPEKLGQSSAALAMVMSAGLLVSLSQDTALVRRHAELDETGRRALWRIVQGARTWLACGLACILMVAWWLSGRPVTWPLLAGIGLTTLALSAGPNWVLQARQRIGALILLGALQSAGTLALYLVFVRPESVIGTDLLLGGLVAAGLALGVVVWEGSAGKRCELKARSLEPRDQNPEANSSQLLAGSSGRSCFADYFRLAGEGRALLCTGVLTYLVMASDLFMVGWLASPTTAGVYRVACVPGLVIAAFSGLYTTALYPRLLKAAERGADAFAVLRVAEERRLLSLWLPAVPLVLAGVAVLLPIFFGEAYRTALISALWLAGARLLTFWNGVYMWSLWAARRDNAALAVLAMAATVAVAGNLAMVLSGHPEWCGVGTFFAEMTVLVAARRVVAGMSNNGGRLA